ncbi:AMP-binding protein [Serratia ureilytica]
MLNLATLLEESARTWPERPAVIQDDILLSYRALNEMANRVANLLVARGVRPGERVALACTNRPEFPAIYYGILKSGAVVVPLNILLKSAEFDYYLADSAAVALFCFEGSSGLPLGKRRCGRRRRRSNAVRCLSSAIGCRSKANVSARR